MCPIFPHNWHCGMLLLFQFVRPPLSDLPLTLLPPTPCMFATRIYNILSCISWRRPSQLSLHNIKLYLAKFFYSFLLCHKKCLYFIYWVWFTCGHNYSNEGSIVFIKSIQDDLNMIFFWHWWTNYNKWIYYLLYLKGYSKTNSAFFIKISPNLMCKLTSYHFVGESSILQSKQPQN